MVAVAPVVKRSGLEGSGGAVIYLVQPSANAAHGLETLCGIHGLSRVETRLIVHLASGLAMAEAAGEMRIKIETARSYLKQIFGKVGVHRQADLMILMSRYQRALRGDFRFRPV